MMKSRDKWNSSFHWNEKYLLVLFGDWNNNNNNFLSIYISNIQWGLFWCFAIDFQKEWTDQGISMDFRFRFQRIFQNKCALNENRRVTFTNFIYTSNTCFPFTYYRHSISSNTRTYSFWASSNSTLSCFTWWWNTKSNNKI